LGDVHLAPDGQPSGRRPDLVHEHPPALRSRRPGRVRRADGPGAERWLSNPRMTRSSSRRLAVRPWSCLNYHPRATPASRGSARQEASDG
jgi:hypothetical protein